MLKRPQNIFLTKTGKMNDGQVRSSWRKINNLKRPRGGTAGHYLTYLTLPLWGEISVKITHTNVDSRNTYILVHTFLFGYTLFLFGCTLFYLGTHFFYLGTLFYLGTYFFYLGAHFFIWVHTLFGYTLFYLGTHFFYLGTQFSFWVHTLLCLLCLPRII